MNSDNHANNLDWYAPMPDTAARPVKEQAPVKKKRGLPVGWRIFLGVLLVVGLIAASSIYFSGMGKGLPQAIQFQQPIIFSTPDVEELPENWQDYFNSYYVTENRDSGESRIPLVEERPAWQLELALPGEEEQSLQEIYRGCVDSIVCIKCFVDGKMGNYWGSGIIMSEDGLVLTNAHLVEDCDSAKVMLSDNREFEAKLVGMDGTSDLAVLKIEAEGLKPAVFGQSDMLSIGERVAAIGNPISEELRASLTDGIISGIDRGVNYDGHSMNLIQTNTAINEGSSGGALLNMYGQVVGVTNMKMMSNYATIEGICFAIPSVTVRNVVNALIHDGKVMGRPAVGITVGSVDDTAAKHYELPSGLYVSDVAENSDAYAKGVRQGDIIIAVNGEPAKTSDDILRARDDLEVGDTITFTIWRDGESFDVEVAMVEYNDIY